MQAGAGCYTKRMRYVGIGYVALFSLLASVVVSMALFAPAHATSPGYNGRLMAIYYHPLLEDRTRSNMSILLDGSGFIDHTAQFGAAVRGIRATSNGYVSQEGIANLSSETWQEWPELRTHIVPCSNGRVYFIATEANESLDLGYLYSSNLDGSGLTKIVPLDAFGLSCSPDGKRLAFVENVGSGVYRGDIFTINTDGTNVDQLTYGRNVHIDSAFPGWSPDGKTIAYVINPGSPADPDLRGIWTVDIASKIESRIYDATNTFSRPIYSPDGTSIVVYSSSSADACRASGFGICVMDADGANLRAFPHPNPYGATNQASFVTSWASIPNTTPVLTPKSLVLSPAESGSIDVLDGATDEEVLDPSLVSIAVQPAHGSASIENGIIAYTPHVHFAGNDSVQYSVCDSFMLDQKCATGTLAITVNGGETPATTISQAIRGFYQVVLRAVGVTASPDANTAKLTITQVASTAYTGQPTINTTSRRPVISGVSLPFAHIRVEIHSDPVVLTTTADESGKWLVAPDDDLPLGRHTVVVTATHQGVELGTAEIALVIAEATPAPVEVPAEPEAATNTTRPVLLAASALLLTAIALAWRRTHRSTKA